MSKKDRDMLKEVEERQLISGPVFEPGPGWGEHLSKWFKKDFTNKFLPIIAILILLWGIMSVTENESGEEAMTKDENTEEKAGVITQKAGPRDGYSVLARRALAKYLETANDNLTTGQKLFIEETIGQMIKDGTLEVGQEVRFNISDIRDAINLAKELTASQLQRWEAWSKGVNF